MEDKKQGNYLIYARDELGLLKVASMNDCTGLIPVPPASESEEESYSELYNMPMVPETDNNKR